MVAAYQSISITRTLLSRHWHYSAVQRNLKLAVVYDMSESLAMGESGPKDYDAKFYEQFYHLTPNEREFFLAQLDIKDEEELKKHIMRVQEDALKVGSKRLNVNVCMLFILDVFVYRSPATLASGFLRSQSMLLYLWLYDALDLQA